MHDRVAPYFLLQPTSFRFPAFSLHWLCQIHNRLIKPARLHALSLEHVKVMHLLTAEFGPILLPLILCSNICDFFQYTFKALGLACLSPNLYKEFLGIQVWLMNHIISVSINNCNILQRMFLSIFRKTSNTGLAYPLL